jgi:hypothetical protein
MQDYDPIPLHYAGFYAPDEGLPAGGFDVLVLTKSVPRNWASIGETYHFADSFFVFANQQMAWETVNRYPKNCLGTTTVVDFVGAVAIRHNIQQVFFSNLHFPL